MNQNDFYWALLQRKLSFILSEYTFKLFILVGFLVDVQQFSCILDKFEVWISYDQAVCNIFDQVFCLIFKMEFNPLPDLLNTEFNNYWLN